MKYELRLTTTSSGVGYFACCPAINASFDEFLGYLREHPLDDFMHRYLLDMVGGLDAETGRRILDVARGSDPVVMALLYEASLSFERLAPLRERFSRGEIEALAAHTPLIDIKWSLLPDREPHREWVRLFEANISAHREMPAPDAAGPALLFGEDALRSALPAAGANVKEIYDRLVNQSGPGETAGSGVHPLPAEETARRALEALHGIDVFAGEETRHVSSLSPFGLFRKWRLHVAVDNGRHDFSFSGIQTSYGKGLTLEAARASYSMEMVERCSSFASVGPEGVTGYVREYPLEHAGYGELAGSGVYALDPNRIRLEAPYAGEPLYWMEGEERDGKESKPILIPVQSVFLFSNLDEINLFSGLGSTGLASGSTVEQARVSALLEVIERDGEGTTPYGAARCFRLDAGDDPDMGPLFADYEAKGIRFQFLDLTGEFGIPCYKCFVVGPQGQIVKGAGAHLNGRKAMISALTEVPYPYPGGPASSPGPEDLPVLRVADLPDYSTGDPAGDLAILEGVLPANGYRPIYVDLTRKDMGIPVVKALVPGLELMADFDRFSRINPRLFANYLFSSR